MSLFGYMINLTFVGALGYLIYNNWDLEAFLVMQRTIVVNYMCVGTHLFMYMHVIGFTGLARLVKLLLF